MEKEENAQAKEKEAEEKSKIQVTPFLSHFNGSC